MVENIMIAFKRESTPLSLFHSLIIWMGVTTAL